MSAACRSTSYLSPAAEEAAHENAYAWIKGLRGLVVDGAPFRDRFTVRGDSLWWFTELYLHREQVILDIHRAHAALAALIETERPAAIQVSSVSPVVRFVAPLIGRARGIRAGSPVPPATWWRRLARLDLRARSLHLSALLAADRYRRLPRTGRRALLAAFIHRAFWRAGGEDGSAESCTSARCWRNWSGARARAVSTTSASAPRPISAPRRRATPGIGNIVTPVERFASH